jgi:hypothetical protein
MAVPQPFDFLHENIPLWHKNIAEIEAKVATVQTEINRVPVAAVPAPKKKAASMETIKNDDDNAIGTIQEDDAAGPVAPPTAMQMMKRKRAPGSVLSGSSGPIKYRSRTMIVLYYDSEVQTSFEALVRVIGTGRNLLRKGKMAAKMDALADMANALDDRCGEDPDTAAKIGYRPRPPGLPNFRSTRRTGGPGGPADSSGEKFDVADKALEKAQNLCERGAHQFLRDGDCRKELNGVRQHFAEVQRLSKLYAITVTKPEEVKVEAEKEEPKAVQVTERTPMPSMKVIEVDDADDGEEWVLPPIRRTTRV